MKRGGLFLAAFLLISGVLRLAGPGSATGTGGQEKEPQQSAKRAKTESSSAPRVPYLEKFAETITDFYGLERDSGKGTDIASYLMALKPPKDENPKKIAQNEASKKPAERETQREPVQFVIALLPDPIHTRLGLFFDRSVEALQQAAQMQQYAFDRAIMPWDRTARPEASDLKARQEERDEQAQREAYPGLMIFRAGGQPSNPKQQSRDSANSQMPAASAIPAAPVISSVARNLSSLSGDTSSSPASTSGPLFVLVVGETPTAGLNKKQFRHALQIIQAIREASGAVDSQQPLRILGPSFSGSLDSLSQELQRAKELKLANETFIYSGAVTATNSIQTFEHLLNEIPGSHFATFQENDDFARNEFLKFTCARGYRSYEVAVLSEDGTVYGASRSSSTPPPSGDTTQQPEKSDNCDGHLDEEVLKLHFPREISYFRSAYQKEAASQTLPALSSFGVPTLPLNLENSGSDDDTVAPYAVQQTSLSQEAVMLGVVSELQKHHIKFTLLLASDPLDQLFLASYLRKAYAQGRVIITVPDLLFTRENDASLRGVLGLSSYSLIPGLSDRLCRPNSSIRWHEDRLFASSLSAGTFNAMAGLLSVERERTKGWDPAITPATKALRSGAPQNGEPPRLPDGSVPFAPYAEYGSPNVAATDGAADFCEERPLLWLSILGRDGFWPIAGLDSTGLNPADWQIPIAPLQNVQAQTADGYSGAGQEAPSSSLKIAHSNSAGYGLLYRSGSAKWEAQLNTPPAWNIAYCLCFVLLVIHAAFSWTGSILQDSENRAQFARSTDWRGAIVLAIGALMLASAFVLILCMKTPRIDWVGGPLLTGLMWLPLPIFAAITICDLAKLRREPSVARAFVISLALATAFQLFLTWTARPGWRVYWSNRLLHITSGLSPVLPVLLLMAAIYWWMWMSLRGVCLVDLRRPRLPNEKDLSAYSYRISDSEGEDIRRAAHPLYFNVQVVVPVFALAVVILIGMHRDLPVHSVEGEAFDWGYTVFLGVIIGAFLGCLMRLVRTWQKCHQVLAGLDRLPLRSAFSRMQGLTWHSFWNPGGSTLRETYKVMSRALENLTRLQTLVENWRTHISLDARTSLQEQIAETFAKRQRLMTTYGKIVALVGEAQGTANSGSLEITTDWLKTDFKKGYLLRRLVKRMEFLQKGMARTAAVILDKVLIPAWDQDEGAVVSTDEQIKKTSLPPFRVLAEEFVSLVYVNFLVSVLLRIRTLVICAGGMYVLIVLSMNVYPFEPHPALQTLAVVLLLVMAAAVGYVYAEMHREVILSRLTSTEPGELGVDFWIKFASAGALPVFSLLAAQFPSINQFLFSWLEPALQAMK